MLKKYVILFYALLSSVGLFAQYEEWTTDSITVDTASVQPSWEEQLQCRLTALTQDALFETSQLGMMVYDLDADSALFVFNHRQAMRPASTMKVLTAVTALDLLGGDYTFQTRLCVDGDVEGRTLRGDVYCVGGLDPLFDDYDMQVFADSLKALGIDTIRGSIYADNSMKNTDRYGAGWCWDDDEDNPVLIPLLYKGKDGFMDEFMKALRRGNIVFDAFASARTCPQSARTVCIRSRGIDQVLQPMMKNSSNLCAEALFYQIAKYGGNSPAKASHAAKRVGALIDRLGLDASQYDVADGSGLSLYNYVSPELEVRFLRHAWRNGPIFSLLYPSLPIAGVDGTLSKRMKNGNASGNVHAKTGTVSRVSSLAGYLTASNGHTLCFSIINQGVTKVSMGRDFQDRVCEALSM